MRIIYPLIVTSIVGTGRLSAYEDEEALLTTDKALHDELQVMDRIDPGQEIPFKKGVGQTIAFRPDATIIKIPHECIISVPAISVRDDLNAAAFLENYEASCIDPQAHPKPRIQAALPFIDQGEIHQLLDPGTGMIAISCGSDIGSFAAIPSLSPLAYHRSLVDRLMAPFAPGNYLEIYGRGRHPTKISYETLKKYCAALKLTGDDLKALLEVSEP